MSRKYKILGVVALFVLVICYVLYSKLSLKIGKVSDVGLFRVAVGNADVSAKGSQDIDFSFLNQTSDLASGSQIKTSDSGRASVLAPDNSLSNIGAMSLVTLSLDDQQSVNIFLKSGGVWSKINSLSGYESGYQLKTENIVASVRGTIFATNFFNQVSELFVLRGTVLVEVVDPLTGLKLDGLKILVPAGSKIRIDNRNLPRSVNDLKVEKINEVDFNFPIIKENQGLVGETSSSPTSNQTNLPSSLIPTKSTSASTPKPSLTESPISTTPQPSPTPQVSPRLVSVYPNDLTFDSANPQNQRVVISGYGLKDTQAVSFGNIEVSFNLVSDQSLAVTITPQFQQGIYNLELTLKSGAKLNLPQALNVKWVQGTIKYPTINR